MNKLVIAAALAAAGLSTAATAQTTFTSRPGFLAAAGAVTTVDFEDLGAPRQLGVDETVARGGATFAPPAGFNLYVAGPGQSANPSTALGLDFPQGGAIGIRFSTAATAFGADFFQNFGGGSQSGTAAPFTISFLNGTTALNSFTFNVASGTGSFFGVTGLSPFDLVQVSQAGGFAVIDNVSFNAVPTAAAVPEPAAWAMAILGFALAGAALRARRTRVAFG